MFGYFKNFNQFNESMKNIKSVLNKDEAIYYVEGSDMIEFVSINFPMSWNDACDFVREHNLGSSDEGESSYFNISHLNNDGSIQSNWLFAFFKAHPWIERMQVVFGN
jgi:hypothetical protein